MDSIRGFANTKILSAIKYATVKPIRDEDGYIYDYETPEYRCWGEDDPRSQWIGRMVDRSFKALLSLQQTYKNASYSFTSYHHFLERCYSKQTGNSPVHKGILNEDGSVNLSKLEFFLTRYNH